MPTTVIVNYQQTRFPWLHYSVAVQNGVRARGPRRITERGAGRAAEAALHRVLGRKAKP